MSRGNVSKARLFVNNTGNRIGLVGYWDVVVLDEFEQEKGSRRVDSDLVKIMQNYMANQSFNRGKDTYQATASIAFVGNTKHTVPYMLKNTHLFESIPKGYIKGAFLDRMHLYIPGWEVLILKSSVFSDGYGFIVDYLAEILHSLRKVDFSPIMDKYVELDKSLSSRDKTAIRKTFSGLVKIIYPHQELSKLETQELINFAIEGRKRVKDQLYIIDETFKNEPVEFSYIIIGVGENDEKNLTLRGIDSIIDNSRLQEIIKGSVLPIPDFQFFKFSYENNLFGIIEINIPKFNKPSTPIKDIKVGTGNKVFRKGTILHRRDSTNQEAYGDERVLIYDWFKTLNTSEVKVKKKNTKINPLYLSLLAIGILVLTLSFTDVIKDVFLPSTKISRDEDDVLDEWGANFGVFDDYDEGMRQKNEMKSLYKMLNHNAFENDTYLVRSIVEKDS